jgi:dihydroxyacetone synthase
VANLKRSFGLNPDHHFYIPQDVYDFFSDIPDRGEVQEVGWRRSLTKYEEENPVLAAEFSLRVAGMIPKDWTKCIPRKEDQPTAPTASRKSAGVATNALAGSINSFLVGTADLTPSCNVAYKHKVDFQSVSILFQIFPFWHLSSINTEQARA